MTITHQKTIKGSQLSRDFSIDGGSVDEEKRTIEISFSSEVEVERWFGVEVLDHQPQSVKLDRLKDGGAVLVDHNMTDQVGVVESARVDDDRVGRAVIRFSKSQRGEEVFRDVLDGIRTKVSVGYRVNKYEVEEKDGEPDKYRMTDWEPFEVSIVAVPADVSVGVGRSEEINIETNQKVAKMDEQIIENEESRSVEVSQDDSKIKSANLSGVRSERERVNDISRLADEHNFADLGKRAIEEGVTKESFRSMLLEEIGKRNNQARVETEHDGNVDLSSKDQKKYSFARLMDALAHPNDRAAQQRAAFELEVSAEGAKGFGEDFNIRGAYIPEAVLTGGQKRDLSVSNSTAGNLVGTTLMADSFIEVLHNSMLTAQAGIEIISGLVGNYDRTRQNSHSSMTWMDGEDSDATESEPTFDMVTLSPRDAGIFTQATRRSLQQSTPAVDGIIRKDLARAIGLGTDLAIHYGTGANGQPTGIANATGINVLDLAAEQPSYAEIVEIIKLVMEDNALMGSPTWFIEANGWESLSTTPKQGSGNEGNFILGDSDRIKGYGYKNTNQIQPNHFFFGDYSQVAVGEWGGLELNVDPYTHALKGRIQYIAFKTMDIALKQPSAFCHAHTGITA